MRWKDERCHRCKMPSQFERNSISEHRAHHSSSSGCVGSGTPSKRAAAISCGSNGAGTAASTSRRSPTRCHCRGMGAGGGSARPRKSSIRASEVAPAGGIATRRFHVATSRYEGKGAEREAGQRGRPEPGVAWRLRVDRAVCDVAVCGDGLSGCWSASDYGPRRQRRKARSKSPKAAVPSRNSGARSNV